MTLQQKGNPVGQDTSELRVPEYLARVRVKKQVYTQSFPILHFFIYSSFAQMLSRVIREDVEMGELRIIRHLEAWDGRLRPHCTRAQGKELVTLSILGFPFHLP